MSVPETGPLWSAQQREWLQALGHPLLVLVRQQDQADAEQALPQARLETEIARPATAPVPREALPPMTTLQAVDGLQRALLRATGLPAAEAGRTLQSLGVDAAVLRGDPAAKRLLWSRLRRLRGGGSP